MKTNLFILSIMLFSSCTGGIIKSEKQKIFNPLDGETIYLKYCLYDNGHEATSISLDSIFEDTGEMYKSAENPVDDYIAYYDNPKFFYKLSNDTFIIYCYGLFQVPKNHQQFKTKIKMIDMDVVELSKLDTNYRKLGYTAFPKCNIDK